MSNNPNQQEPNTKLPTVYDIKREEIQRYLEETEEEGHTSTVTATFLTLVDAIEWEKHLKKGGVTVCEVHPVFTDW